MKFYHLLFLLICALTLGLVYSFSTSKKLQNIAKKDLQKIELSYKKRLDSIQDLRKKEVSLHEKQLLQIDQELKLIENKLELQKQKIKTYEKELATYRNGDFDERFDAFSNLVKKDSL